MVLSKNTLVFGEMILVAPMGTRIARWQDFRVNRKKVHADYVRKYPPNYLILSQSELSSSDINQRGLPLDVEQSHKCFVKGYLK